MIFNIEPDFMITYIAHHHINSNAIITLKQVY